MFDFKNSEDVNNKIIINRLIEFTENRKILWSKNSYEIVKVYKFVETLNKNKKIHITVSQSNNKQSYVYIYITSSSRDIIDILYTLDPSIDELIESIENHKQYFHCF